MTAAISSIGTTWSQCLGSGINRARSIALGFGADRTDALDCWHAYRDLVEW
jgi:hypothetical protein